MPKRPSRKKNPPSAPSRPKPREVRDDKSPPQQGTASKPLPRPVLVGFKIAMFILGFALVGLFIVKEMKDHPHGVGAWIGHSVTLGFAALFMLVALAGLAKTQAFVQGMATAWRTKGGG